MAVCSRQSHHDCHVSRVRRAAIAAMARAEKAADAIFGPPALPNVNTAAAVKALTGMCHNRAMIANSVRRNVWSHSRNCMQYEITARALDTYKREAMPGGDPSAAICSARNRNLVSGSFHCSAPAPGPRKTPSYLPRGTIANPAQWGMFATSHAVKRVDTSSVKSTRTGMIMHLIALTCIKVMSSISS